MQHPGIKAVTFTGWHRAGRALMDLVAARSEPIPVFAEMGSTNPVFILPGALRERGEQIATGLHASFTIGVGQFCTKPGLVFVETGSAGNNLVAKMAELVKKSSGGALLTSGIASAYRAGIAARSKKISASATSPESSGVASAVLFEADYDSFARDPELAEELFGPENGNPKIQPRSTYRFPGRCTAISRRPSMAPTKISVTTPTSWLSCKPRSDASSLTDFLPASKSRMPWCMVVPIPQPRIRASPGSAQWRFTVSLGPSAKSSPRTLSPTS